VTTLPVNVTAGSQFACPYGIAALSATTLVVQTDCDSSGSKTPSSGTLWRLDIGSGAATLELSGLARPRGLAALGADTVVVSDHAVDTVSVLTVSTASLQLLAGKSGMPGATDGSGDVARFSAPYGVARSPDGTIVVADFDNQALRRVTTGGVVSTYAGHGVGMVDGTLDVARFDQPKAVAVDAAGDLFVSDTQNHRIRRVSASGVVETLAGDGRAGFMDGNGSVAELYGQEGIAVTSDGKTVYVADGNGGDGSGYHRIRKIVIP
jgi:DNA-binding beta-propeller fold protein YncE